MIVSALNPIQFSADPYLGLSADLSDPGVLVGSSAEAGYDIASGVSSGEVALAETSGTEEAVRHGRGSRENGNENDSRLHSEAELRKEACDGS